MAILNVIFVCVLPRLLCGLLTMAKRVKRFLQMDYNDGGFAKQVLHFITAYFVDLLGRLFHMKQNLNFGKVKMQEFKQKDDKVQIICLKIQVRKSFFLKKILHFVCYFCENLLTLFCLQ